ncbi:S9 family peptidase [Natrinema halophilum]|uniref:S9 family peptidase n=1 Tax=Natrinema halophilum TaxID=1699371 RepID=UPI001F24A777|nr:alpha/beta fold hydrolase [Natrinema halophilum]UHQ96136.1 prolyl oligopeptidase family serine peptidase [Natrinema halophilum]
MTAHKTPAEGQHVESLSEYVHRLAGAHGVSGYTKMPDDTVVYAAYGDGDYDLWTSEGRLTHADGDITSPTWLRGHESILAYRDVDGNEQFDLLKIDPETGAVTPVVDDQFLNVNARQAPTDPNRIAFISNRDRSLDLYTYDIDEGTITKQSEADEPVMGYAWSPDGHRIVYQAGTFDDSALQLVDLHLDRDDVFIDEPDSEQSFAFTDDGDGAWSEDGIVFTTNHETGYRELAVTDGDGDYRLCYVNNHDKYDPQWTDEGDIAFIEARGGDRRLCVLSDGDVTTVERTGMNMDLKSIDGDVYYKHWSPATAGDLRRDGATVVEEGQVDVQTVFPEEITYESFDGREIAARLYRPEDEPLGGVVKVHGGPEAQHYNRLDIVTQTLVRAGFEVLAPDFRGSLGYGRDFRKASDGDLGGDDLTDVVAAAAYLRNRGRDQVGILGASYGGYMALMGVGATDAFDMGASVCGVVNWETTIEEARQYLGDVLIRKLQGTPEEKPVLYEERSPITYTDDIDVPLLIVQGANDPRVPKSEAEQLVSSVEKRDVDYEYLLFEDEGHGVERTENRIEYITRTVEFFSSHV